MSDHEIPDVLQKIAARVRERLEEDRELVPIEALQNRLKHVPLDFRAPFQAEGIHIIAEVKLASPSEGDIAPAADPVKVAGDYLASGATALSVLTERDFFKGSSDYLAEIRKAHPGARLLMKDFIVDEYQLVRARADGADAVLLIVALLGQKETRSLLFKALSLGLTPLVEVHDLSEMEIALDLGVKLVGVNNRNLRTMKVSLDTSEELAQYASNEMTLISESGIENPNDVKRLKEMGFKGFLIGTSFMRTENPGAALSRLRKESEK